MRVNNTDCSRAPHEVTVNALKNAGNVVRLVSFCCFSNVTFSFRRTKVYQHYIIIIIKLFLNQLIKTVDIIFLHLHF